MSVEEEVGGGWGRKGRLEGARTSAWVGLSWLDLRGRKKNDGEVFIARDPLPDPEYSKPVARADVLVWRAEKI